MYLVLFDLCRNNSLMKSKHYASTNENRTLYVARLGLLSILGPTFSSYFLPAVQAQTRSPPSMFLFPSGSLSSSTNLACLHRSDLAFPCTQHLLFFPLGWALSLAQPNPAFLGLLPQQQKNILERIIVVESKTNYY